jgi:predicted permease
MRAFVESIWRDLRGAGHACLRQPGFTLVAVGTLALGVGANAAMFSLVDQLMIRPPAHVREFDRLVAVVGAGNYVRYQELSERARTLALAAYTRQTLSYGLGPDAFEVRTECVTPTFFPVLGVAPSLGRSFRPGEDALGEPRTVVLAHHFWSRQFASDPGAIGQTATIAGRPHAIIGVAPRRFTGLESSPIDAWILVAASPEACSFTGSNLLRSDGGTWLRTIARIRDGVSPAQASTDLTVAAEGIRARAAERGPGREPVLQLAPISRSRGDGSTAVVRQNRLALWLAGGAAVLLLIACANVAGLLSMRALNRRREIALRLQLGASRGRIFRQLGAENVLLAAVCAIAATAVAAWIGMALRAFLPMGTAADLLDGRSIGVLAAFAVLAALLSGIVPAVQASRSDVVAHLRSGQVVGQRSPVFRHLMLTLQIALALVLVVGAGLFVRSVQQFRNTFAYDIDDVVVVAVDFKKAGVVNSADIASAYGRMLERVRALPQVEAASVRSGSLLGAGGMFIVTAVRRSTADSSGCCHASVAVSRDYFDSVGLRLVQGRTFTLDEARSGDVVILNEKLARDLFPGQDAVGNCVLIPADKCHQIVGVSELARRDLLRHSHVDSEFFVPLRNDDEQVPQMLLVRPRDAAPDALTAISAAVRSVSADLPFISIRPLADLVDIEARSWRMGAAIFSLFGILAVALAVVGIYAALAFSVQERTAEIGVRMALGAMPRDILGIVVRHALAVLVAGWCVGAIATWSLAGAIKSVLFNVAATDIMSFLTASVVIAVACLAGCFLPAVRAARTDPAVTLRYY